MKSLFALIPFLLFIAGAAAQTIVVHPDGTHSVAIDNGSTSTIVHPDGTHSTAISAGPVIVNPDGTHTTAIRSGNTTIIAGAEGRHSTLFNQGATSVLVNPDGTQAVVFHAFGIAPFFHFLTDDAAATSGAHTGRARERRRQNRKHDKF